MLNSIHMDDFLLAEQLKQQIMQKNSKKIPKQYKYNIIFPQQI